MSEFFQACHLGDLEAAIDYMEGRADFNITLENALQSGSLKTMLESLYDSARQTIANRNAKMLTLEDDWKDLVKDGHQEAVWVWRLHYKEHPTAEDVVQFILGNRYFGKKPNKLPNNVREAWIKYIEELEGK